MVELTGERVLADGRIRLSHDGSVAAVTLDNPDRLNAMSLSMWEALGDIAEELATDEHLRLVTLTGAGDRAFAAGADISEFGENRSDHAVAERYNATVRRAEAAIEALPVPTLALIQGYCIGGGLGIAMRCDIRLSADDAIFAITAAKLGLGYGFDGVASLHGKLGPSTTADLLFTGRKMFSEEAMAKGIVDRVFLKADFAAESAAAVEDIASNAPLTCRATKAALIALRDSNADRSATDSLVARCFDSADYAEGQVAFAEKRKPVFQGR